MKIFLSALVVILFTGCVTSSDGINSKSCTIKPPKSDKNYNKPKFGTEIGKED